LLQVRCNLITADPVRWVARASSSSRGPSGGGKPERQPGNVVVRELELGVAIPESFWASRVALVQSAELVVPTRSEAVRRAGGTVTIERYPGSRFRTGGAT
jgi:hypothetical protein